MTPEAHRRCQEVFDQACERPAEDRVAFVSRELRDSPALLAHTLSLVANCSFSSEIQGKPGPGDAAPAFSSRVLGDFQLEGVLGEGGMGTVYRASQRSVGRAVALKVMKAGLAKPAQLRQFEDEIRSVGKLEHPGIARLYSADWFQSETGNVPYFAMELVEGVSLSVFAAARRLSTRSRLELVALVADAVEFANSQGVIHRDLKPANILVTAQGTPKVLDFGLARLIAPGDAVQTVLSQADQLLGTLAYMSPEQARDSRRADARSDVYSLGVILYELLADRLPYPVQGESVLTALRIIDEANLIPLRVRRPELSGDIDTIASKALSKDPAARYQSAGELAADIRRHLRDEPIIARPPGRLYLAGKFARRNKVAVLAGAGMFLALSVGLVISTAALSRSRASESSKEAALKQLREQEYDIYAAAAGTVKSIELSTLAEMVREDVTPEQFAGFIDRAIVLPTLALARSLDSKISPKLRVGFLAGSADVYVRLERFADAEPLLIEVIGTLGSIDDSPTREYDIAVNKVNLAAVYRKTDRAALAEPLLTQALAPLRASSTPSDRQDFVKTLNTLAKTRLDLGQAAAGETVAREALAIQRELTGQVEEEGCGRLLCTIGDCVLAQGRVTEAAAEYEHALSIPTFAVPGPLTMTCVQPRLAEAYITMGRLEDARRVLVGTDVHLKDPASPRSFRVRVHETYVELFDALAAREPGAGHEQSASAWRQRLLLLRAAP